MYCEPLEQIPELLFYSHIPAMATALLVGFFLFFNNPKALLNRLMAVISILFALWTIANLYAWIGTRSDLILFTWSHFGTLQALISIFSVYFIYVFLTKRDVSLPIKSIFLLLTLPVILLSSTHQMLGGIDITWCDAFDYENQSFVLYYNLLGGLAMIWILFLLIKHYKHSTSSFRRQILLMGVGIESFLFLFFFIVYVSGYFTSIGILNDSDYELYGLFGMMVFMVMMGVLIVRFKTFNVGAMAAQVLVVALLILVGSQITYVTTTTSIVLATITFILTAITAYVLIKAMKREMQQRKEIEELAQKLQAANGKLKVLDKMKSEFVSIASHQLRSPLTAIRGYASMLLEGSFGNLSQKATDAVERISESSRFMALSIEDYLNVSRIEAGNMKYEMSDFNAAEMAKRLTDDLRPAATKRGLVLMYRSDCSGSCTVHADEGKMRQVIQNIIDNAMKYTPHGSIDVITHNDHDKKELHISIKDTGVGMSPETMEDAFDKFVRAKNAASINSAGTGLGLFVAKKMLEEMGGRVWAESEGEGKGSTFHIAIPTV